MAPAPPTSVTKKDRLAFHDSCIERACPAPEAGVTALADTQTSPGLLQRLSDSVILSAGWRRRVVALGAGAAGALALPPVNALPALLVSMSVAVWLIDGSADRSGRRFGAVRDAAGAGWWWGFGYFLAGLWWLGSAFLVEADKFAWLMPLGVVALPAGLAFFPALGFALARLLWSPGGWRVLALAFGLGLSEWLRGNILTGFPWNAWGMALAAHLPLAQTASLVGLWGLTLLAIAIGAAPATLTDPARRRILSPILLAALAFVAMAGFGGWRLGQDEPEAAPGVRLRIMQPNLAQDAKFRPENGPDILGNYIALSRRGGDGGAGLTGVTHLVWPESAFPFLLSREQKALAQIGAMLPQGTQLITGAARAGDVRNQYFNAIQVVSGGEIVESYDKVHLVPFGEYLPLGRLLRRLGLTQFVHIPGGFDAGFRRKLLFVRGLPPVGPLICYEAIFPGEVTPAGGEAERPGLLLNVTNDGWFGMTSGPYQHLAQARLRTIEEGLPLVRAANTGVSAVVDSYGRIKASLGLGVEGVLDSALPGRIEAPPFARHGALTIAVLFAMSLAGAAIGRIRG